MDRPHQVFDRRFDFHGCYGFGDQFCRLGPMMWTPRISPYSASVTILMKPSCWPTMLGAGVGGEGELADLQLYPASPRLRFGEAYAANFGMAVGRAGNAFRVDRFPGLPAIFVTATMPSIAPTCASCGVPSDDVADGVDAGFGGLHPLVRS